MKFRIEQIAIYPPDPAKAIAFLEELGAEFVHDVVVAKGEVYGMPEQVNTARLAFDYELASTAREFEVLHYQEGNNWMQGKEPAVSHLGCHCTKIELVQWFDWFTSRGIGVAQAVFTKSHTNPFLIENGRKFQYVIFNTRHILGVDLKFIVRIEKEDVNPDDA